MGSWNGLFTPNDSLELSVCLSKKISCLVLKRELKQNHGYAISSSPCSILMYLTKITYHLTNTNPIKILTLFSLTKQPKKKNMSNRSLCSFYTQTIIKIAHLPTLIVQAVINLHLQCQLHSRNLLSSIDKRLG